MELFKPVSISTIEEEKYMKFPVVAAVAILQMLVAGSVLQAQEKPVHVVAPSQYTIAPLPGVTTKVIEDGKTLSVSSTDAAATIVLDLGWLKVAPQKAYHATYKLRAQELASPASARIMIREHEAQGQRPIQPYHNESVRYREVKPTQKDWLTRRQGLITGEKTTVLSGSIIISQLKGELHLSATELFETVATAATPTSPEQAMADSKKALEEVRAQAATRKPLTPRPLVFSRTQMKYGLEKNYYHEWNDRPLLVSRDYRTPHPYVTSPTSYKRILEEVVNYDIDGLAFFPETKGRMEMFDVHEKSGVAGVGLLPEFVNAFTPDHVEVKTEIVRRALKSPNTPRINGKVLITSYAAESITPAEWKTILDTIRSKVGDTFVFLPSLTNVTKLRPAYMAGQPITRAAIEVEKAYLREYLDVCDGIYFNYPPALRNKDRSFDGEFYRDVFIPMFKSVLSEPKYQNKYLGLSSYRSHMSPERGNTLHEDGTRTLRRSFEAAMDARPDVILLPEWDEVNENTSFRPTLHGGTTSMRILRYYMSKIKSKAPTPVPGDDVTVPNLIFSARKAAVVGENLVFELLNLPDSATPGRYTVELTLADENGKVVKKFEPVAFDSNQLQEHRLTLATETIPNVRALVPSLTVRGYKGRDQVLDAGLQHVQLRATWNWDHLFVKQPLRDLIKPVDVKFAWEGTPRNAQPMLLTASVKSPDNLALVEVLGDDDEVYAFDPTDEFWRADATRELFLVEYRSGNDQEIKGSLSLKNGTAKWLTNGSVLHQEKAETEIAGNRVQLSSPVSAHLRWIYLAVPKADLDKAQLDFDFDKAKFSVTLREVLAKKIFAQAGENGLHLSVRPYRRQIDMPRPLNSKEAAFTIPVWPEVSSEQFHLRLTTTEGKQFRSKPLVVPGTASTGLKTLRVYSDAQKRGVDVQVAADRIPNLTYDFEPEHGAVVLTDAGQPFWATLGGYSNTTTGRGTANGLLRGQLPANAPRTAPEWETVDGRTALKFNGKSTYLELPREALPWRGAFTMSFDIKPASEKDQVLVANRVVNSLKGLLLEIKGGKLMASFPDADWKANRFATELAIPAGQWSTVKVRYDFENMVLSVNGKSQAFPLTLPASSIGFTLFGEGWKGNWFEGHLSNLQIVHNVE
jgi:hypothetical protein